jgi:hypothetical protein
MRPVFVATKFEIVRVGLLLNFGHGFRLHSIGNALALGIGFGSVACSNSNTQSCDLPLPDCMALRAGL